MARSAGGRLAGEKGNAAEYETGGIGARSSQSGSKKLHPMPALFVYCPDSSILNQGGKVAGIDYKHCKGCGICANECPSKPKALEMVAETESG